MAFEALGKNLYNALRRVFRAPVIDEETVKQLTRDIQGVLLLADVNVKLVLEISKRIEDRALIENKKQFRNLNMKWLNVYTAEKRSPKTMSYTATCVELPSAKNAEPPDYVPQFAELWESEIDLEDMEAEEA